MSQNSNSKYTIYILQVFQGKTKTKPDIEKNYDFGNKQKKHLLKID